MKQHLFLAGCLLLLPTGALAQVTVNPAALQQLAGIEPPPLPMAVAMPVVVPVHHWPHTYMARPKPTVQISARVPAPVVAKPLPPKAAPTPPALPAVVRPAAPVTLVFAPGSAGLSANAAAALKPFCASLGKIGVDARAPTDPADPSAAMRLSLDRAMAIQAALTACGVPAQNILPRADGNVPGKNEDAALIGAAP